MDIQLLNTWLASLLQNPMTEKKKDIRPSKYIRHGERASVNVTYG